MPTSMPSQVPMSAAPTSMPQSMPGNPGLQTTAGKPGPQPNQGVLDAVKKVHTVCLYTTFLHNLNRPTTT